MATKRYYADRNEFRSDIDYNFRTFDDPNCTFDRRRKALGAPACHPRYQVGKKWYLAHEEFDARYPNKSKWLLKEPWDTHESLKESMTKADFKNPGFPDFVEKPLQVYYVPNDYLSVTMKDFKGLQIVDDEAKYTIGPKQKLEDASAFQLALAKVIAKREERKAALAAPPSYITTTMAEYSAGGFDGGKIPDPSPPIYPGRPPYDVDTSITYYSENKGTTLGVSDPRRPTNRNFPRSSRFTRGKEEWPVPPNNLQK